MTEEINSMSPNARMDNYRFGTLLVTLLLLMLIAPILYMFNETIASILITILYFAIFASAVFAVSKTRTAVIVALSLAIPAIICQWLRLFWEMKSLAIVMHIIGIIFLLWVIIIIVSNFRDIQSVNANTILASLSVYLLLGLLWSLLYSLIEMFQPNSFVISAGGYTPKELMEFGGAETIIPLYYSFVTMTTLGYGDIIPISPLARMLAIIQAIIGQLYLVVLVAWLVGMYIAQTNKTLNKNTDDKPNR